MCSGSGQGEAEAAVGSRLDMRRGGQTLHLVGEAWRGQQDDQLGAGEDSVWARQCLVADYSATLVKALLGRAAVADDLRQTCGGDLVNSPFERWDLETVAVQQQHSD